MELRLKPYAKLAAFGAIGVAGAVVALFLFLVWNTRSVPLGGIDQTQSILTILGIAVPFSLIIGAHLVYARILFAFAKE